MRSRQMSLIEYIYLYQKSAILRLNPIPVAYTRVSADTHTHTHTHTLHTEPFLASTHLLCCRSTAAWLHATARATYFQLPLGSTSRRAVVAISRAELTLPWYALAIFDMGRD